jgi:hypothetical protein
MGIPVDRDRRFWFIEVPQHQTLTSPHCRVTSRSERGGRYAEWLQ